MYDINFFEKSFPLKKNITSGKLSINEFEIIEKELEELRDKEPTIFNIETTNYCNMKCVMCPRTIYMTRKNIWIDDNLFERMLDNIKTHKKEKLDKFWNWLEKDAKFNPREISENGFYFSIVSRCLILHGYGEPFLDNSYIQIKSTKKKYTNVFFMYTMTVEKAVKAMENGLTVLKFI